MAENEITVNAQKFIKEFDGMLAKAMAEACAIVRNDAIKNAPHKTGELQRSIEFEVSEDGTEVLLSDRFNDFFIPNQLSCQSNCEYSDYLSDSKYLKCLCNIYSEEKIEIKEPEKITAKKIKNIFYNTLKYSNYKVLMCYKLVFRRVTIFENVGSILSNIYFIGYLISFGLFIYKKELLYLIIEIKKLTKLIKKEKNIVKNNYSFNRHETKSMDIMKYIQKNDDLKSEERKETNIIKIKRGKNNIKREKKNIMGYKDKNINHSEISNLKQTSSMKVIDSNPLQNIFNNNIDKLSGKDKPIKRLDKLTPKSANELKYEGNKYKEILTDYELNKLDYYIALKFDKRNFFKTYWYLLKREHIIIFTFFNKNDYNIFSIKLSKLFLAICADMAFNVFFFSDETMHNIYVSKGKYDYIGQLAQMIYSTIVSQVLQIIINYLTMTDIQYYKIKENINEKNINEKDFKYLINCIKYKIIIFYSFTFLLFLSFWYSISAFCAVYENTQYIFIKDSISSFIMELIYPFILYLPPAGLRIISLKAKEKKNLKFLYFLSDKIPIF